MSTRLISYLIATIVLAIMARRWWVAQCARNWPSVIGKVSTARIVRGATLDDPDEPAQRTEYFDIEVRYEYRVGGKSYVSTTFSYRTDRFSSYDDAIDALSGIASGREARVYYDPKNPRHAVLRT